MTATRQPPVERLLEVKSLSKTYGSGSDAHTAIKDVSFAVEAGEIVCIVGPSGCGKTTLLKCMAGLLKPSEGASSLRDREIQAPPDDLAVVFQDYARSLYPWLTVRKNIALPQRRGTTQERQRRVSSALDAVGLSDFADRYPWQLSGGMQQRVAIARAIAYQPRVMLMDEPFASVDAQTRADLEDLVLRIQAELQITVMLVTHDIDESVYMADRVIVLTKSPSVVQAIVDVELPKPRNQITTKESDAFVQLRSSIYRMIVASKVAAGEAAPELSEQLTPQLH